jgi:hypothetical protein
VTRNPQGWSSVLESLISSAMSLMFICILSHVLS